ncbi:MAG: DUF3999 domain-containing protein [Deferribacteraceae bacterium]|jgi:hypothetical protein|nr:DUF3999 domain-containing protein [Deferribacteraceae bacterium]
MRIITAVLLVFFLALNAAFSSEMPDYAYGIKVEGSFNEDGVYKFSIPIEVYERATDSKLSDIAIFNASGEKVPFSIARPVPNSYMQPEDAEIIFYKETYEKDNKTYIKHLIANIGSLSGSIKSIRFSFDHLKDFTGDVTISYSLGDIGDFRTALYNGTLAKLGDILQDNIEISQIPEKAKFLKIVGNNAALEAITGAVLTFKRQAVYDRVEKVILMGKVGDNNQLDFGLTGYYPVEFISLRAPEAYLYRAVVINTAEKDNSSNTTQPQLDAYPILREVSGYPINNARTRRIRIKFDDPPPTDASANFYWRADDLIFMAKGAAPFTLAYGNISEKGKPAAAYEQLAKTSNTAERIEFPIKEFVIAGESALIAPPEEKHTVRKVVLLSVMSLVVLLVSAIAVRLLIKGAPASDEKQ